LRALPRLWCVWAAYALLAAASNAQACEAERVDDRARVAEVYDGDTVLLSDGRKLRLIGLNAPELGHDGEPDQPYAKQATRALRELLARRDGRVSLRYGAERRDHYDRWLAHLYLPDGRSVTATLLRAGLATHLTVPPNVYALECYRRAEAQAIAADIGLWRLPQYRIIAATELKDDAEGFHRVRGRIVRIGYSRSAVWLNLDGGVALRIERSDTSHFSTDDFSAFEGKEVVARGWIYRRNGELRMQIRHPAELEAIH
jgi:micrococcal nuclease